jgi:Mn2+/Fe2+ NRAMP family transporter
MAFSNLVAFAIILTAAVTLHDHGGTKILTAADAASALRPVAGRFAFALFAIGIIGTGLLAVPVLAGSAGYAVSEVFHWRASLRRKAREVPQFYAVISLATVLGVGLNFVGLDAIKALYWSAVFNGLAAAPLMIVLMKLSGDPKTVQQFRLPAHLRVLGWIATTAMIAASVFFLYATVFSKD